MINVTRCYKHGHMNEGWLELCDDCGASHVEHAKLPETAEDIGILRADYNRCHANDPGFVPSSRYDANGKKMCN